MIDPESARTVFTARLPGGTSPPDPREGFSELFRFHNDCPVSGGVEETADGDMMLFQYGTYGWGEGRHFEMNLTRQVIFAEDPGGEDHEIWQFRLTYLYAPQPACAALGMHEQWIEDSEADQTGVLTAHAVAVATTHTPKAVTVDWAPI